MEVATMVRVAVVGTVDGAVYSPGLFPVFVIIPHPGLQVGSAGYGTVALIVPWVMSQVTPLLCKSLVSCTLNCCCSPVGTVAVAGVMETAMPESSPSVANPDFEVFAAAVAVMIMESEQDCGVELQLFPGSLVRSGT